MDYKATIGLEIHAELATKTKMFCSSPNNPEERHPNINICPVCVGHPGTLPVINKEAVAKVIQVGLAIGGEIPPYSRFDRKNYFYPDLPKGYQISQYQYPLVKGGSLAFSGGRHIRITRVHLEEDTGSLIHDKSGALVDFNRAGVPLMELVTEPEITSASEAREFAEELQLLLRYIGVSNARMEMREMRVEANISLSKDSKLGTKVEVKNLNSFRSVERAILYEVARQREVLESGKKVVQETRGWDEAKEKTVSQRKKEEAHDYRYFPEPDLPPLDLTKKDFIDIEALRHSLPELPSQKRERLTREYKLDSKAVEVLVRERAIAAFFEEAISELKEWGSEDAVKILRNYLLSDLTGLVKEKFIPWNELLVTPENFAELVKMISKNEISSRAAKDILRMMVESGGDPSEIAREKNLLQTSDKIALEAVARKVIDENPKPVADYKKGKQESLQFLVGRIMRETKGSANPQVIRDVLIDLLRR